MSTEFTDVGLERRQYSSSSHAPFRNAGNIFLYFGGGERGRILESITTSIRDGGAIAHVRGERGSGKTMLALVLADRLAERHNIIRFDHDCLDTQALLCQLSIELCPHRSVPAHQRSSERVVHPDSVESPAADALDAVLLQLATGTPGNRPILLIIDSAATIRADVMALLGRLCNVRCKGTRSLQVVLFERVASDQVRTYGAHRGAARDADRHQADYSLRRLTLAEISEYLRHHMLLCDFNRRDVFTREMAYFIADRSEGVFRSINTIARNAFMLASLENEDRPGMAHLLLAGLPPRESPVRRTPFVQRHRRALFALLASSLVLTMFSAVMMVT